MTAYEPPTALPRYLLNRADMNAAIAAHDFGTVFRLARAEAGISYSKIAAECDIKPERVGALARGSGSVTTFDKIVRISDALRIPGSMIGLAPRPWEGAASITPKRSSTQHKGDTVRRRQFVKATATAGLAAGLAESAPVSRGRRIGAELPEWLRRRTARLRRLDEVLGGGDTYRVYIGEYQATKALIRDGSYSEETRRALLSVLAEQAQQAGWAAFDSGKAADATSLYQVSYEAAAEAGDTALEGNALAFLAYQTVNSDRRSGVEIAARSCATAGPNAAPGVRALLYERLAWASAVAGLTDETARALGSAEEALSEVNGTPQPDWVAWVDHRELQIMAGRCWAELGRPLRAVPMLETSLAGYDDAHARDKSLYLSWLAGSYVTAGEIEQAAITTHRALDLCDGVASVRPLQRLAPVVHRLSNHRELPAVTEMLEHVRV